MSAKKESLLPIAAALEQIGCCVGDDKNTILTKFQATLKKSTLTEEVNRTLNLLTYDYSNQEYFTEEKKGEFFELLNNESPEVVDYVLRNLHIDNYWSIVTDATGLGYRQLVGNETVKGLKSARETALNFTKNVVDSGWGFFSAWGGGCMPNLPQIPGSTNQPHVDLSKKLQ